MYRLIYAGALLSVAVHVSASVSSLFSGMPVCQTSFGNASFDLSDLRLGGSQTYSVKDADQLHTVQNYTYIFNVCANASVPDYPACNITWGDGGSDTRLSGPAPAFQVHSKDGWCHRLGHSAYDAEWGLFDTMNPSRGVTLTYLHGDGCGLFGPSLSPNYRSLKLWLECADDLANIPDQETVEETETCFYEIYLRSAFGCPTECPLGGRHLCSANGVCDFDRSIGQPRCFCHDGWEGADCGTQVQPDSGLSGTALVLIFVSVLLVLLSGLLGFLWSRIRRLRLDPTAYSFLQDGDDAGL